MIYKYEVNKKKTNKMVVVSREIYLGWWISGVAWLSQSLLHVENVFNIHDLGKLVAEIEERVTERLLHDVVSVLLYLNFWPLV